MNVMGDVLFGANTGPTTLKYMDLCAGPVVLDDALVGG